MISQGKLKLVALAGLLALPALFLSPATALACPFCLGDPNDPFVIGLSLSMLFMVSVPFLLVGFIGLQLMQALNPKAYYGFRNRIAPFVKHRYVYVMLTLLAASLLFFALTPGAPSKNLLLPRDQLAGQIDLNGETVTEPVQFNNKIVLVNFFASWCEYCKTEVAGLGELDREYRTQGVEIIGITYDFEHPDGSGVQTQLSPDGILHHPSLPNALHIFLHENSASYIVISNTPGFAASFGSINAIPTTFLFDRQGTLIKQYFGPPSMTVLKTDVQKLLTRAGN